MESIGFRVKSAPSGGISASRLHAALTEQRITTLQLGIGSYCACIGALALVAPHNFAGPLWSAIGPYLPAVGSLFLLVAALLLACPLFGCPRPFVVLSHVAAGAAMLAFVANFLQTGLWPGVALNLPFALGIALAPLLPRVERAGRHSGYLLAVLFGAVNAVFGLVILLTPDQFGSHIYDVVRPRLSLYGIGLVLTGAALLLVQFRPALPARLVRLAHLAGLVPCIPWVMAVSIPAAGWNDILYFGGLSLVVASLPWVGPRLLRRDPRTLSARLSSALALTVGLSVIAITALVVADQERHMKAEVERSQEGLATALAGDVSNYIGSHRKALVTLAAYPGLLALPPAGQQSVVQSYGQAYPDAVQVSTFDAAGRGIARSDGHPPTDMGGRDLFEEFRRANAPLIGVNIGSVQKLPVFAMFQPIRDADGRLIGGTGMSVKSEHVAALLNRVEPVGGREVYLVDATGHAMAHPDRNVAATFADLSATPPVAAALVSEAGQGTASYRSPDGEQLAAYARVPGLGWTVVVEQPVNAAMAAERSARDAAFGSLLLVLALAMVVGTTLARQMTRPLASLSEATGRLARGDNVPTLPSGGSSEVRALVTSFEEMRDKLGLHAAERELLLATVQEERDRLSALVSSMTDEVWLAGTDRRFTLANPPALHEFGVEAATAGIDVEELAASLEMLRPDGSPRPIEEAPPLRALRGAVVRNEEEIIRTPATGELRYRLVSSSPVRDAGGNIVASVSVARDITEMKRASDRIKKILESISDGFLTLDRNWRYTYFNETGARMTGMSRDDLIGGRVWDLFPYAEGTKFYSEYHRAVETALPVHFEEFYPEPLNLWLECHCYPSSEGLSVFFRDVTERKRAEDERVRLLSSEQAARKVAEEAVQARDEFLSIAAHELKTPVTSLRGYAQLLLRQFAKTGTVGPERLSQALQVIDTQSLKLAKLVSQLLDTSRLDGGRLTLARQHADLVPIVETVVAAARLYAGRHTLVLEAPSRVEAYVDPLRIEQVLTNLLDNAIRYSPNGGPIEIGLATSDAVVEIAMRDHGIGIPQEYCPYIFDRFYRAHEGASVAGLGLGLYVSKEIVTQHGGRIEVECPPDGGTRFVVSLPVASRDANGHGETEGQ